VCTGVARSKSWFFLEVRRRVAVDRVLGVDVQVAVPEPLVAEILPEHALDEVMAAAWERDALHPLERWNGYVGTVVHMSINHTVLGCFRVYGA
jgi:hypothetical protein